MKISELLEAEVVAVPPVILRTDRFIKEAAKWLDGSLQQKLVDFIEKKQASPLTLLGTRDRVGSYDLKGWNHYHLRYGNTVLIHYQATQDYILLASVTDHRAVDGGTDEVRQLGAYLKAIHVPSLKSQPSAVEAPSALTKAQLQDAEDIIYELAAHTQERTHVEALSKLGQIDLIKDYFEILDLPLTPQAVKQYQEIAARAVRMIPAPA